MPGFDDVKGDDWAKIAKIYKQLTVGVGSKAIEAILTRLDAAWPFAEAGDILDNGTGPGPILAQLIREYGTVLPASTQFLATDFSRPMIEQVEATKEQEVAKDVKSPWSRVSTAVCDATDLNGIPDMSKTHVTAGWVFFLTGNPSKCLDESMRVLKPGGVLGCSSWKGSQWMELMNLVPQIRQDKRMPAIPTEWSDAGLLSKELQKAGFCDVESAEVAVTMEFEDYGSLIALMTEQMPHMIALIKDFSPEEKEKLRALMLEKAKEMAPTEPGTLQGTALVAVGRRQR